MKGPSPESWGDNTGPTFRQDCTIRAALITDCLAASVPRRGTARASSTAMIQALNRANAGGQSFKPSLDVCRFSNSANCTELPPLGGSASGP